MEMCEECVWVCSVPLYCKPCHAPSTKHILSTKTVLVCMCCTVQGMCLKPLLAMTVIHCWSSGFLTTSCSTQSPKWLVGTHCTSTGPPTVYWGWTSTWVGGAGDEVDVNIGGWVGWGGHQHGCGGRGGGVDVNMGGWSGSPVVHEVEVQCK